MSEKSFLYCIDAGVRLSIHSPKFKQPLTPSLSMFQQWNSIYPPDIPEEPPGFVVFS